MSIKEPANRNVLIAFRLRSATQTTVLAFCDWRQMTRGKSNTILQKTLHFSFLARRVWTVVRLYGWPG